MFLLSLTQLGYYIYDLYTDGYAFSFMLGYISALSAFSLYRKIDKALLRMLVTLLFIPVFFHVLGFYSLLAVLLFLLFEIVSLRKDEKNIQFISIISSIVQMVAVPFLYYKFIYVVSKFPNIYLSGFPTYQITNDYTLYLPFLLIVIFIAFMVISFLPGLKSMKKTSYLKYVSALVLIFGVFLTYHFSFKDKNFKTELAMEDAISKNDWYEVLKLRRQSEVEATRLIVMQTNLALRKLHIAGDKMFAYKNGNKPINCRKAVLPIEIAGKMLYFHYGKSNYCYRWCMEEMMYNGMRVDNLKYFVKSCLLNQEYKLAEKYNRVLLKTLFHKSWAEKYQNYIENPEKIKSDSEFNEISPLLYFENKLYSEDKSKFEEFLRYSFATVEYGTERILDISLQSILEYKNLVAFWSGFEDYTKYNSKIPIHYQEAALLCYSVNRSNDVSKLDIDKSVLQNFREFIIAKNKTPNLSTEQARLYFEKRFGNTYWFYYYFS